MSYQNLKFCWHGIITTDVERAKAFYPEVLGWSTMVTPMGEGEATMFAAAGVPRLHVMPPPMPGMPSHWENYLRVADVDQATRAAKANGGAIVVPPTDIPPGRFSVVTSPSGAALSLFHEADPAASENPPPGPGSIHWTELHSTDLDADLAWLRSTLGVTTEEMPIDGGGTYYLLNGENGALGGAMASMHAGAPAYWLTWVEVEDADAALGRVKRHGGTAMTPVMEMKDIGRMAVVADPTGGVFGVITPPKSSTAAC